MFLRLLFFGLIGYWGYKLFKGSGNTKKTEVKGKQKSEPLDLDDADVQDATFEDMDES